MFPVVSVNEVTAAVVSFHPTATMFKLPAVCAAAYFTVTDAELTCGVAYATCTNLNPVEGGGGGGVSVVPLALLEYPLRLPAASVARTR